MKLLLINPEVSDFAVDKEYFVPLSMISLATLAKNKGVEVLLVDLNVIKYKKQLNCTEYILNTIKDFNPDLVGIGCMFSGQFESVLDYSNKIKELHTDLKIVLGGMHPTLFYNEILQNCSSIDFIVMGEGEVALDFLIKYIKGEVSIDSVPSLAYKDSSGNIVNSPRQKVQDINVLPMNDYSFIDIKDYYHHETVYWHNPKKLPINATIPILTSRGCPMDCNFCCLYEVMGKKMRYRNPMDVVDEIEMIHKKYNHHHFSFFDDNLIIKKNHIVQVCNEIVRRNINIQFETPNGVAIKFIDDEVLEALCSAGMTRISLPIEHGSDYIRNQIIKKKLPTEKIYEVVEKTKKYKNLQVRAFFIIGFPEETMQTLEDTFQMIKTLDIDKPIVNNLMPYAGTELFNQCAKDNLFVDKIDLDNMWKVFDLNFAGNKKFFIKPYQMEIDELIEFRDKFDNFVAEHIKRKTNEHPPFRFINQ